ncbi:hypothetical protein PPYR_04723 [Photinus pyralis]|uniref:Transmembrane protein 161B n=1 Tax=Photinus pyralis TaxID=7054 RepID=A0A1Y1KRZ9_PHOPY|nr:transmembrane protein 161B-like [Photinus pyralis]XP_031334346.1 transmembrane protein 161B-like [Photinus pyralis]KAB0802240.1 hypothetical protein PPYR_04426 [Photinus pyralis]KAB0802537.1 hypothetical protein PPYR_04723 [Photinus pyralis]
MALLGAQLVITLVMISIIQKVGPHYSLARWLLCSTGLIRYLYPTDSELRQLANIPKDQLKWKKGHKHVENGNQKKDTFHVPRSLDIQLETCAVSPLDVVHLRYFVEYQWLLDFTLYSIFVYIITEIYHFSFPEKNEVNLSMMWCALVITFALKLLISLTTQYFKGEESVGERSTCIVTGFVYFLISMLVLIVDENVLEVGLDVAYANFNASTSAFLTKQGLQSSGLLSKIVFKFFIAVFCGFLGALFTFPGLRIAKMHWDLLKYFKEKRIKQLLLNLSFVLPFILVILWIKPVSRNYLTVRKFSSFSEPLLHPHTFESVRFIAVILTMLVKMMLTPWYLQAYLDMAYHRMEDQKKEAGRITNVDLQKRIAAVFYYLCVATLQYIIPLIICLNLTFMYKTLGGFSWKGVFDSEESCPVDGASHISQNGDSSSSTLIQSIQEFHTSVEDLKSVFNPIVFRGLFGFATWWCCFLYFATTSTGMVYQSYFTRS